MDYLGIGIIVSMVMATILVVVILSSLKSSLYIALRNLIFPKTKLKNVKHEAGFIILHPLFWILSFAIATLFLISFIFTLKDLTLILEWLFFSFIIIIFSSLLFPLIVWYGNKNYVETLKYVIGGISFGLMCAVFAYFINTILNLFLQSFTGFEIGLLLVFIVAPIIEEVLKVTGIYILAERKRFNDVYDGVATGFSIGCGFALLENIFFIITKIPFFSLELLLFRVFYNTLAHASFSTFGGIIIGKNKEITGKNRFSTYIMAIFVSLLAHMAFNILAMMDVINVELLGAEFYMFSPAIVVLMVITIVVALLYKGNKRLE
jgi:RsiW-degrading membrane proteinase PrsW (M82 family)